MKSFILAVVLLVSSAAYANTSVKNQVRRVKEMSEWTADFANRINKLDPKREKYVEGLMYLYNELRQFVTVLGKDIAKIDKRKKDGTCGFAIAEKRIFCFIIGQNIRKYKLVSHDLRTGKKQTRYGRVKMNAGMVEDQMHIGTLKITNVKREIDQKIYLIDKSGKQTRIAHYKQLD